MKNLILLLVFGITYISAQDVLAPTNIKIPKELCDLRKQDCSSVHVIADNIIPGNVTCFFENKVDGNEVFEVSAKLLSSSEVTCKRPINPLKPGRAQTTLLVTIANGNGKLGTSDQIFKVYDSNCLHCTDAAKDCSLKKDTCMINGTCFLDGEADPKDPKKCKVCIPSISTEKFVLRFDLPAECQVKPKTCIDKTCKDNMNFAAVGCFDQKLAPMKEVKWLFSARSSIKWDKEGFKAYVCSVVCRCGKAAKKLGYKYFSIRFWGECMASNDKNGITEAMRDENKKSKACVKGDGTYRPCDNSGECIGIADTDYIYSL